MLGQKATLVTDVVHEQIALSPFEKRLVSTQAYNRLHNILQNSTVFFTYPCNRTSRFIHSLGVAKIAGDIFRFGFLNACEPALKEFFRQAADELDKIRGTSEFRHDVKDIVELGSKQSQVEKLDPKELWCPVYTAALLPTLTTREQYLFIIFYQAVRCVALLHDVGHPPFSHVTENALTLIYGRLKADATNNGAAKKLLGYFDSFFNKGLVFHEALGHEVAETLLGQIIHEAHNESGIDGKLVYDLILIKHLTIRILSEDENRTSILRCLHKIVDGDLDADRLDYVQRDLVMSGFSREPIRPQRLIQSFTLAIDDNSKSPSLEFVPSVRALGIIEDFYVQRLQAYKYIIYHHRVVKFDALLESCTYNLAIQYLNDAGLIKGMAPADAKPVKKKATSKANGKSHDVQLSGDISGLWQVFHPDVQTFKLKFTSYYTQWDDAWLLTVLRAHYLSPTHAAQRKKIGTLRQTVLEAQLEELLSNKKQYHSLYKRGECFLDIDDAFLRSFDKNFDWDLLKKLQPKAPGILIGGLKRYVEKAKIAIAESNAIPTSLIERNGYALALLKRLLYSVGACGMNEIPFAAQAAECLKDNMKMDDVILIPKLLKPGLKKDLSLVDGEGKIVQVGKVSRLADELDRATLLFPPFFVFVYKQGGVDESAFAGHRQAFGMLLWQEFDKWIKKVNNKA